MYVENGNVKGYVNCDGWECSFVMNGIHAHNILIKGEYKGNSKEYHSFYNIEHLKEFPKNVLDAIHAEVHRCEELSEKKYHELRKEAMNDFEAKIRPMIENLRKAMGDDWDYVVDSEFGSYFVNYKSGLEIPFEI